MLWIMHSRYFPDGTSFSHILKSPRESSVSQILDTWLERLTRIISLGLHPIESVARLGAHYRHHERHPLRRRSERFHISRGGMHQTSGNSACCKAWLWKCKWSHSLLKYSSNHQLSRPNSKLVSIPTYPLQTSHPPKSPLQIASHVLGASHLPKPSSYLYSHMRRCFTN